MQVRDINTYIRREMFGINTQSCSQATRLLSSKPGRLLLLLCNCQVFADSLKSSKWWRKLCEDLSFHCFTNWHRATHSPFFHSLFLTLFLCFSPLPPPFFPFEDPTTAFHNSEHHPAILWTTQSLHFARSFFFFLGMSQSQQVGTNKSFWFIPLSKAKAALIA